jgi:hypothetical protein
VVIDRHGRDADLVGDPPHAHSFWAFGLEEAKSALVDLLRSAGLLVHLYSVYQPTIRCIVRGPNGLGSVTSKDEVASFDRLVAGIAGFYRRLADGPSIGKLGKPPPSRCSVFL